MTVNERASEVNMAPTHLKKTCVICDVRRDMDVGITVTLYFR